MKQFFLIAFIFLYVGLCRGQEIAFSELGVINLEEDKGPFATLNDEIVIWVMKVNTEHDIILSWEHTEEMIFSDSIPSYNLNLEKTLNLDSFDLVYIALIELDGDNSIDSLDLKLKGVFLEYYAFPLTLLKEKIRLSIRDDDILGLVSFGFEDSKLEKDKVVFKGMHMFNRFEYVLRF